jgi:hypothetical protein
MPHSWSSRSERPQETSTLRCGQMAVVEKSEIPGRKVRHWFARRVPYNHDQPSSHYSIPSYKLSKIKRLCHSKRAVYFIGSAILYSVQAKRIHQLSMFKTANPI